MYNDALEDPYQVRLLTIFACPECEYNYSSFNTKTDDLEIYELM